MTNKYDDCTDINEYIDHIEGQEADMEFLRDFIKSIDKSLLNKINGEENDK